jgi:hypothetical protein
MNVRPLKPYVVVVKDPEGVTSQYFFTATSRKRASADAREWVARTEWGAVLVSVEPAAGHRKVRRLLAVAGVTFALSAATILATMIVGLSLEGAL